MQNPSHQISSENSKLRPIRAAIVGTGYIADYHARAIRTLNGVELANVCDSNLTSAQSFAAKWNIPGTFKSLEAMIQSGSVDTVHVLVPPDHHFSLVKTALDAGLHVLVEKPMCTSVEEAKILLALATSRKLRLGVNHNMLYADPYSRLREVVHAGVLGPLTYASFNHFLELPPIRFGPYNSWMLRDPGNIILEIGPHVFSALLDLVGTPDEIYVTADRAFELPGGNKVLRRWRIHGSAGRTMVDVNIDLGPGYTQRTIQVRGLLGTATLDFDANTCTVDQSTAYSADFDRFRRSQSLVDQVRLQARHTLIDYLLSKLKVRHRGNPYETTFLNSVGAFYDGLAGSSIPDSRIDGHFGLETVALCKRVIESAHVAPAVSVAPLSPRAIHPTVLVFGGTGFIGRELVKQLLAAGYEVRAAVRSSSAVLEELHHDHLEIVRGDLSNATDLKSMVKGIDYVFHLARANAKTWQEYLQREVDPVRPLADACLAAGVKRLIYTGTIDSYYAGAKAGTITEQTPLDPKIGRRNYYARAKAEAESILMEMHRNKRLPLVIFRPGIVIGRRGNPFHWGVGKWISEGLCDVWGDGNNKLPFVLVEDVAAALVRSMKVPGIEGRSFNLIDVPLLTANDYLNELEQQSGMRLAVRHPAIWRFYINDLLKWVVKMAVRHPDRARVPYYFDWESRTQKGLFDCTSARVELGWEPASDRKRMVEEGIGGSLESWLTALK